MSASLGQRDSRLAEAICLILAIFASIAIYLRIFGAGSTSWMTDSSNGGISLSLAGWWCIAVSNPTFWFLLLRWVWRLIVWSLLLRQLARLALRLVATHPGLKT